MRRSAETRTIAGLVLLTLAVILFVGGVLLAGPMAEADCSHEDQADCQQWNGLGAASAGAGFALGAVGVGLLAWRPMRQQWHSARKGWNERIDDDQRS